jgi:hypothetical protein
VRTPAPQVLLPASQFLADLGHGVKYRLGDFGHHMELTDLMPHARENLGNRLGIQGRTVRGDAPQHESSRLQGDAESPEEFADVLLRRVVVQDAVGDPLKLWLSTMDSTQYGPSQLSAAMGAENR